MKRLVLRIMLILLLASVLTMAFNAGSTDATGQVFYPPHSGWDVFYSADKLPNESEPPWVLTESFVVHEKIHQVARRTVDCPQPGSKFRRG